jgi:N-acetylglucosaminyldiphosphoundecaprenol N-acetyl-beta-D-mannosaminyltransferase
MRGRMSPWPRFDVLDVTVDALSPSAVVDEVGRRIDGRSSGYVCVTNVHSVMECVRRPPLRDVWSGAALVVPDGVPLTWVGRRLLGRTVERVYGPDLALALAARAVASGWRVYLYGGTPGVADALGEALRGRFPGLDVVGTRSPPFRPLTPEEDEQELGAIRSAAPHLVLVGLGCPKQEVWMAAHAARLPAVLVGVGAAFDFHTGAKRQAPRWMMAAGLEWLFRLGTEPRRLWRRYLVNNPWFMALVALQLLGLRRAGPRRAGP